MTVEGLQHVVQQKSCVWLCPELKDIVSNAQPSSIWQSDVRFQRTACVQ